MDSLLLIALSIGTCTDNVMTMRTLFVLGLFEFNITMKTCPRMKLYRFVINIALVIVNLPDHMVDNSSGKVRIKSKIVKTTNVKLFMIFPCSGVNYRS